MDAIIIDPIKTRIPKVTWSGTGSKSFDLVRVTLTRDGKAVETVRITRDSTNTGRLRTWQVTPEFIERRTISTAIRLDDAITDARNYLQSLA